MVDAQMDVMPTTSRISSKNIIKKRVKRVNLSCFVTWVFTCIFTYLSLTCALKITLRDDSSSHSIECASEASGMGKLQIFCYFLSVAARRVRIQFRMSERLLCVMPIERVFALCVNVSHSAALSFSDCLSLTCICQEEKQIISYFLLR